MAGLGATAGGTNRCNIMILRELLRPREGVNPPQSCHLMPPDAIWQASPERRLELAIFAEPNEFHFGILCPLALIEGTDRSAKWTMFAGRDRNRGAATKRLR